MTAVDPYGFGVNPPAVNAMVPTNVPAGNERARVIGQSTVQEFRAGSNR